MRVLTIWFPSTFPAVNPPKDWPHVAFLGTILCFLILCLCSTLPLSHSSVRTRPSFQSPAQISPLSPPLQAGLFSLPLHSLSSWYMAMSLTGHHTPSNTLLTPVFLTQLSQNSNLNPSSLYFLHFQPKYLAFLNSVSLSVN